MAYSPDRNVTLSADGYSPTRDPAFASGTGISGSINGLLPSVSGTLSSDTTWEIYGDINGLLPSVSGSMVAYTPNLITGNVTGLLPVIDGQLLSNDFAGIYGDISGFAPSVTGAMLGGERSGVTIGGGGAADYSPSRSVTLLADGYSPSRTVTFAATGGAGDIVYGLLPAVTGELALAPANSIYGSLNGFLPTVSGTLIADNDNSIFGDVTSNILPTVTGQINSNPYEGVYGSATGLMPYAAGTMLGGERTGVVINPAGAGSYSPSRGITLSVTSYSPLRNPDFEPTGAPPVYGLTPEVTGHIEAGIYAGIYGDLTGLFPSTDGLVKTNDFEGVYGDLIGLLPQVNGLIEGANQISGALNGLLPDISGYVGDHSPKEIPFSFARSFDGIQILSNSLKYTSVITNGVDDDIEVPIESLSITDRYYNNSRTMLVTLLTPADLSESLIGRQAGDVLTISKVLGVVSKSIFEGSITNAFAVNYKYQIYAKQTNKPVDAVNVVVDKLLYVNKTGTSSRYRMPVDLKITPLSTLTIEGREFVPSAVTSYISLNNAFMEVSGG